ncbi:C40 family peptidase [Gaetbulibacter sp. M235]|uniref:C40 family peptidase n=1 Tax=Gaetbulibacter sp. M235 TaxID=3126510 RepID=UPI00374F6C4D
MKYRLLFLIILLVFHSCKSSKYLTGDKADSPKVVISSGEITEKKGADIPKNDLITSTNSSTYSTKALDIIDFAKQFEGVKYKPGGTTKSGMDCSGLVFETFKAFNILLPRISRDMAKEGDKVLIDDVKQGDLLFFKTTSKRNVISHVGLVVTSLPGNIEFIHSTTSQGVIISSLVERYWYYSFVEARRML